MEGESANNFSTFKSSLPDLLKYQYGSVSLPETIDQSIGSVARGEATAASDLDLLVTLDDARPVTTDELLEMAGEAEELVGRPVNFVIRRSVEQSSNAIARNQILNSAVCIYGT